MIDREIFKKLTELKNQAVDAALATIVETTGSTPRRLTLPWPPLLKPPVPPRGEPGPK